MYIQYCKIQVQLSYNTCILYIHTPYRRIEEGKHIQQAETREVEARVLHLALGQVELFVDL